MLGMPVAHTVFQQRRKEVNQMKNAKSLLAALILLGNIAASGAALADDGVISKTEDVPGSYCNEKFRPIEGRTLASNDPVLRQSGDVIDYYGPCTESPVGKDQVQEQKLELQHRWANDYED
jgi:hypothetical protein